MEKCGNTFFRNFYKILHAYKKDHAKPFQMPDASIQNRIRQNTVILSDRETYKSKEASKHICLSCHSKIARSEFPPNAIGNVGLDEPVEVLSCLNDIEHSFISQIIPTEKKT